MRILILTAVLACATAAPSGLVDPVPAVPVVPAVPAVAYSAIPTISPGDLQAAAIDAKVKAEDLSIAAADKARELSEQAAENLNEKVLSTNDQVKEKVVEEFWSVEDKKWQAIDALKTAEAQIDGSVASQADVLAKSALVLPYAAVPIAAPFPGPVVAPIAPVVAPVPAIYPGFVAPPLKTTEQKPEEKPEPAKFEESLVKAGEGIKEENKDSVAVEAVQAGVAKPNEARPVVASIYAAALPAPFGIPVPFGYPLQQIALSPIVATSKSVW